MWVIAGIVVAFIWILWDESNEKHSKEKTEEEPEEEKLIESDNPRTQKVEKVMRKTGFTKRDSGPTELKKLKGRWRMMLFVYFPLFFLSGVIVPFNFVISIIWISVKYVFIKKRIDSLEKQGGL